MKLCVLGENGDGTLTWAYLGEFLTKTKITLDSNYLIDWREGKYTVSVSRNYPFKQGCGSGSELHPDAIGAEDLDLYSESGSGSRRAKMTRKSRKKLRNFMFEMLDVLFWQLKDSFVTWTSFMEA